MLETLKGVLRPGVPYVTLVQNARGLLARHKYAMTDFQNVLVLSPGGYGHVALPLTIKEEPLNNFKRMSERKLFMSYVGSMTNSPSDMRGLMARAVNSTASRLGYGKRLFFGKAPKWREIMADSRFSLCPRGFGRTAFHVFEALRMGLVPIHIYTDR